MLIKCNKILSPVAKEDLGDKSPWLTKANEYIVLSLVVSSKTGIHVYIQTDHYDEPGFFSLSGFEVLSQKIPSSWVTLVNEIDGIKTITMLPESWSYDSFFEDVGDEKLEAVALFNKEAEIIYREEKEV